MIKKHEKIPLKKEYNLGIRILKTFLSFMVVIDHLYNPNKKIKLVHILYYHIPTFFLISFYLTYKTLTSFNISKIKLRLERLIIPYFSWCTISWIIKIIYFYLFNINCSHSFIDFIRNLTHGHMFNVVLWFQAIIISMTFLFLIIIFIFKNNYLFILTLLGIIAFWSQYSEANFYFFKQLSFHYCYTFGRFAEAFPNAVTGFIFAWFDIINILKAKNKISIFYSIIVLIMISKYNIFSELNNFKYAGLRLNIAAICIFFIFSLTSFKISSKILNKIILQITNYTAGIYFIHVLIGRGYLAKSLILVKNGNILGCILIYIISYIICCIGEKLFRKTKFKHLFV